MDPLLKGKATCMSIIMRNKKLSKQLSDALKSDVGSTKRQIFAKMVNVLEKSVHGGMGGMNYGQGAGPDDATAFQQPWSPNVSPNAGSLTTPAPGAPQPSLNNQQQQLLNQYGYAPTNMNDPAQMAELTKRGYTPPTQGQAQQQGAPTEPSQTLILPAAPPSLKAGGTTQISSTSTPTPAPTPAPSTPAPAADSGYGYTSTSGQDVPFTQYNTTPGPGGASTPVSTDVIPTAPADINDWYAKLTPDQKSSPVTRALYETLAAGLGTDTFMTKMLSGTPADIQARFAAIPNFPSYLIPKGSSEARGIAELQTTLRQQYGLDTMEDNLKKLNASSPTVEKDLSNYITARDQYVGNLDKMIKSAQDMMATKDISDPTSRDTMNQYMNYLYVLKGRQQQRYIDAVQTGVNYFNQQVTNAKADYDSAFNKFTNDFNQKSTIADEDWKNMTAQLTEIYNGIANRGANIVKGLQLQNSQVAENLKMANNAIASSAGIPGWTVTLDNTAKKNFGLLQESQGLSATDLSGYDALDSNTKLMLTNPTYVKQQIQTLAEPKYIAGILNNDPQYLTAKGAINWSKIPAIVQSDVLAQVQGIQDTADTIVQNGSDSPWNNTTYQLQPDQPIDDWKKPLILQAVRNAYKTEFGFDPEQGASILHAGSWLGGIRSGWGINYDKFKEALNSYQSPNTNSTFIAAPTPTDQTSQ